MTVIYGVDYSAGAGLWSAGKCASFAAALAAASPERVFAATYLDRPGHFPSNKQLTVTEFNALIAAGRKVVIFLEDDTDTALGGASIGTSHAQRAKAQLAVLGIPTNTPIFYTVDTDTQNWTALGAYFDAIAAQFGGSIDSIGVYGGYQVVKWALNNHKAKWAYQAQAWSTVSPTDMETEYYGTGRVLRWDARSHLRQHGESQTTVVIDGTNCNADSAYFDDYGQYPRPTAAVSLTHTFYGSTADRYLSGHGSTYAASRDQAAIVSTYTDHLRFGQQKASGVFYNYETFMAFDPSPLPHQTVVDSIGSFALYGQEDYSTTDFTIEVYGKEWLPAVDLADWVPGASMAGMTLLASRSSAGWSTTGYNTFTTTSAFVDLINAAIANGTKIQIVVTSSRCRLGTAPTANEFVSCVAADAAGSATDPKLTFTYHIQVSKALETSWDAAKLIAKTQTTQWNIYRPVILTRQISWATRAFISKTQSTTWNMLGGVIKQLHTTWDDASALTPVIVTKQFLWSLGGPVIKTLTTTWRTEVGLAHSVFHIGFTCRKRTESNFKVGER
jgi:hypothetical protein